MAYRIEIGFAVYRELMRRRQAQGKTFDELLADALGLAKGGDRQRGQPAKEDDHAR